MAQYNRFHAAQLLLAALGNPNVSGDAAYWLAGWSAHEIQCGVGCSAPQNNLWACGENMPGSTTWNPPYHVQNYPTLSVGISAMVVNLHDGRYTFLLSALQANDIHALTQSLGVQHDLAVWCGSQCYSQETGSFISDGLAHANDLFDGDIGTSTAPSSTGNSAIGSCKACAIGLPLACATDEQCVVLDDQGHIAPGGFSLAGVCVSNTYASSVGLGGSSASDSVLVCSRIKSGSETTPGNAQTASLLPGWLTTPDWARVGKFVLGIIVTLFGLGLMYLILAGKVESSQTVKSASQAVAAIG